MIFASFPYHKVGTIYSLAITHDNKTLFAGNKEGDITVWDFETHLHLYNLDCRDISSSESWVKTLAISEKDDLLLAGNANLKFTVWNIKKRKLVNSFKIAMDGKIVPIYL